MLMSGYGRSLSYDRSIENQNNYYWIIYQDMNNNEENEVNKLLMGPLKKTCNVMVVRNFIELKVKINQLQLISDLIIITHTGYTLGPYTTWNYKTTQKQTLLEGIIVYMEMGIQSKRVEKRGLECAYSAMKVGLL